jgi:hypothetical protein
MSSHTVSLKCLNRATLEGMNGCIGKELTNEAYPEEKPISRFWVWIGHVFDMLSTAFRFFRQIVGFLRFRLKNSPITYHGVLSLRAADPVFQTESKGNFCLMTLYGHKTLFQPQALRAKKQTFSNSTCCHFAPPIQRRAVKAPLSIVSLRTYWRGAGGEVCAAFSRPKLFSKIPVFSNLAQTLCGTDFG